jgi:hypothetical protein
MKSDKLSHLIEQCALITITLTSSILLYTPLTTHEAEVALLKDSIFGKAVLTSINVYVANACLIASSAPYMMDIILDLPGIAKRARRLGLRSLIGVLSRSFFLASNILPSYLFLSLVNSEESSSLPYLYSAMSNNVILLAAWGFLATMSSLRAVPGSLLVICILSLDISSVLQIRRALEPNNTLLKELCIGLSVVFILSYFLINVLWIRKLYLRFEKVSGVKEVVALKRSEILCALYG